MEKRVSKKDFERFVEIAKDMAKKGNVNLYLNLSLKNSGVPLEVIEAVRKEAAPEIRAYEEKKTALGRKSKEKTASIIAPEEAVEQVFRELKKARKKTSLVKKQNVSSVQKAKKGSIGSDLKKRLRRH